MDVDADSSDNTDSGNEEEEFVPAPAAVKPSATVDETLISNPLSS